MNNILNTSDFIVHMTDEDFIEIIEMGEAELFCNSLTLDLHGLENSPVKNLA